MPGHHYWDLLQCLYWTEFFVWPVRTNLYRTNIKHIPESYKTKPLKFKITLGKQNHIYEMITKANNSRSALHTNLNPEGMRQGYGHITEQKM